MSQYRSGLMHDISPSVYYHRHRAVMACHWAKVFWGWWLNPILAENDCLDGKRKPLFPIGFLKYRTVRTPFRNFFKTINFTRNNAKKISGRIPECGGGSPFWSKKVLTSKNGVVSTTLIFNKFSSVIPPTPPQLPPPKMLDGYAHILRPVSSWMGEGGPGSPWPPVATPMRKILSESPEYVYK